MAWRKKNRKPLSATLFLSHPLKHHSSVCPENKLSGWRKPLVQGSYLCKSCVCFQFHVGATSFTFILHSRKFMYFLHVIANFPCTPRSSVLFLLPLIDHVCITGSCIFHMDQWGCMLITDDYEYLMLQYCFFFVFFWNT